MYDEAGKLPIISMLLEDALHLYPKKGFIVIPQARPMTDHEYKTDYAIVLVDGVSFCVGIVH